MSLFIASVFSLIYILINVYAANPQLINQTLLGDYSVFYKTSLVSSLIVGLYTSTSTVNFIWLFIISILTGMNLALLLKKRKFLKINAMHLSFGGGSILGTLGGGCASCGLPLLGILGLGGSIGYLPFKGLEFSMLSAGLLSISFFVLSKNNKNVCEV